MLGELSLLADWPLCQCASVLFLSPLPQIMGLSVLGLPSVNASPSDAGVAGVGQAPSRKWPPKANGSD